MRPGATPSIEHLSHILLLQVMREHLAEAPPQTAGWLAALADPPVARAVAALHADPTRAWTLKDLASEAHLSRTAFALRFKRVAGRTAMDYLRAVADAERRQEAARGPSAGVPDRRRGGLRLRERVRGGLQACDGPVPGQLRQRRGSRRVAGRALGVSHRNHPKIES